MLFCFMACLIGSDCDSHFPWSSIRRTSMVSREVAGPEWWVARKRLAFGDCYLSSPGQFRLLGNTKARFSLNPTRPRIPPGTSSSPPGRMARSLFDSDARKGHPDASFITYSPGDTQKFPGLGFG